MIPVMLGSSRFVSMLTDILGANWMHSTRNALVKNYILPTCYWKCCQVCQTTMSTSSWYLILQSEVSMRLSLSFLTNQLIRCDIPLVSSTQSLPSPCPKATFRLFSNFSTTSKVDFGGPNRVTLNNIHDVTSDELRFLKSIWEILEQQQYIMTGVRLSFSHGIFYLHCCIGPPC